ncbi:hypothetical protein MPTK1_7g13000 [Marchantia polymorpha subsp. ruderalis]|uniref:Uncharacterized protein n=2 Tax=Marchantia polymorpha TaxID=3197 RepID=A0AAF6BZ06_MARPO|nr:hypothetical protein MARPO_0003s0308 [Marchantia polymorpha]PTQ49476.1 hypothetical protein MARPO_0003s0308 [Marchantia polymorpha]BBN17240.1 hypothetical protein Mp_7g13000 [Marchantia polymorpha subsp. ruderalis]BBN17241.1 hypothetical protein Mp_7g13000 [Marchantia polymorpha subsp. ruderalis]|eukprot:PTQ49475.1 hypothetical protein MARPO_0003s0308 [Marchantia polymorpha]
MHPSPKKLISSPCSHRDLGLCDWEQPMMSSHPHATDLRTTCWHCDFWIHLHNRFSLVHIMRRQCYCEEMTKIFRLGEEKESSSELKSLHLSRVLGA